MHLSLRCVSNFSLLYNSTLNMFSHYHPSFLKSPPTSFFIILNDITLQHPIPSKLYINYFYLHFLSVSSFSTHHQNLPFHLTPLIRLKLKDYLHSKTHIWATGYDLFLMLLFSIAKATYCTYTYNNQSPD